MDPNKTLTDIRQLCADMSSHWMGVDALLSAQAELVELVSALDEWLSSGGFPPADWDRRG